MTGSLKDKVNNQNEKGSISSAGLATKEIPDSEIGEVFKVQDGGDENALERNFDVWGVVGIVYSSIGTPLALGTYLSTVIGVGGAPFFFYTYLFAGVFSLLTAYCMAEFASVHPHSSALVYWSYLYCSPKYNRALAYLSGILSCACWIFGMTATGFFVSDLVLGLVYMHHPNYVSQTFHYYLVFLAGVIFAAGVNIFGTRLIPLISRVVNYVINLGTLFTLVALLARAHPKQTAAFAFKDVTNLTGWSSNGVVFFMSMLPTLATITLFDGACHMTDEIPNPRKNIPTVITYGYTGAYLIGLVSVLVYNFCIVNPENLLDPVGGIPLFQLYVDSLHNEKLATVSALIIIVTFLLASIGIVTSTSRLVMAFANFKGLPFAKAIGSVNTRLNAPVWAVLFVAALTCLIGLLIFASTTALNAVSGSLVATMYVSYLIPFGALVLNKNRYGKGLKPLFDLGRWGRPLNIICIVWFLFAAAWMCVPSYVPVTANTMNYTVAVLGATAFVAVVNWFAYARKHFSIDVIKETESEEENVAEIKAE
ncbi:unnamed protein product [Kuraishia capsulata CBS 1993]|uniref:Amino acid permease/ SLC12A domain-containing protein n=1 Tax=Kuraishia capsulata CBS 1993 TaxID=1382522 RepID=W6MTX8_9ASCO|nr:uncharacterized protein KUCA_T00001272001 [Kuraishia capsulata CBS 1993]CDK25305.1 unnamed protein product [Kuraishia capsulata CBS 1993]